MPKDWLQLLCLTGWPKSVKRQLVTALGSPAAVLRADSATLAEALGHGALGGESSSNQASGKPSSGLAAWLKAPPAARRANVDADVATLQRIGGDFIGFDHADFPPLLNQINAAPLGLFVLGDRALLASPQLAIVGSRAPSPSGRRTTEQFAAELSGLGFTITSGMALGIDRSAHRGCLDANGKTIAVVATGIDGVYPREHAALSREIAARGLIVSEYPPGSPPKRECFPQRNRLISGLSLGTLVVEAGIRSGSLITARLAGEQGREVFAVPGSIHLATSRGCHRLLRQGAKLVESSADIVEEISQFFTAPGSPEQPAPPSKPIAPTLCGESARLYAMIDYAPAAMDQLIEQSGLTADQVSYILMELELSGLIAATAGGYQRLPQ